MKEDFLHYCWKFQYFNHLPLKTTSGDEIEILQTGKHNHNAGPDFLEAKIRVAETIWAGNVEIHTQSSQWFVHKHQYDKAYQNVILHVVFEHDKEVNFSSGKNMPVLQLKEYIDLGWIEKYESFIENKDWIPCASHLNDVPKIIKSQCIESVLVERLEEKTNIILNELKRQNNDWAETFYIRLAHNFGFKVNSNAFEMLAKSIPLKILAKHSNDLEQIEALLFGQAGMLTADLKDDYPKQLFTDYNFYRKKYKFTPIEKHLWRFARMRPGNFPTIRIAHFAQLIFKSKGLFSELIAANDIKQIQQLFDNIIASKYWNERYIFDTPSVKRPKRLGRSAIENIIINTVAPIIFSYGQYINGHKYKEFALYLLTQTKAENNHIIKKWEESNLSPENAFDTQALIQLKNNYCNKKNCLNCTIGHFLIKTIVK